MYCSQYSVNDDPSKCAILSNNILEVLSPTNVAEYGHFCCRSWCYEIRKDPSNLIGLRLMSRANTPYKKILLAFLFRY